MKSTILVLMHSTPLPTYPANRRLTVKVRRKEEANGGASVPQQEKCQGTGGGKWKMLESKKTPVEESCELSCYNYSRFYKSLVGEGCVWLLDMVVHASNFLPPKSRSLGQSGSQSSQVGRIRVWMGMAPLGAVCLGCSWVSSTGRTSLILPDMFVVSAFSRDSPK